MAKKRYWHRKQLEATGNSYPNTLGRRRNSKEKETWHNGFIGTIVSWASFFSHPVCNFLIRPKLKRSNGTTGGVQSTEELQLEIRSQELLIIIVIINVVSLFYVNTEFVPDEYWQSTEVAHKHVYGQGHLTWEWDYGLRSYLFPMIHMVLFKILKFIGLDFGYTMVLIPRLINTVLMIIGELHFFLAGAIAYGVMSSVYSTMLLIFSWFTFYCSSRLLTNTTEMALNMIAMYYYNLGKTKTFIFVMAINFSLRPTAIVPWLPQLIVLVTKTPRKIIPCFIVGIITLALLTYVDSYMYGYWVLPIWQFLSFNFLQGRSAEFGTHPLFWYAYNAIPSILLLDTYTFYEMFLKARNYPRYFLPMTSITTFIALFSIVGHKEIRFVLPVLPFIYSVIGDYHHEHMCRLNEKKKPSEYKFFTKTMWVSLALHMVVALYLGREHQGAIKPASQFINRDIWNKNLSDPSIWVMMSCYTVPVHTYLHHPNAEYEYFTCGPSKMGLENKLPNFQNGSFESVNLRQFCREKLVLQEKRPPDYVMVFSPASDRVRFIFKTLNVTLEVCFQMGHVRIDETLHPKAVHVL